MKHDGTQATFNVSLTTYTLSYIFMPLSKAVSEDSTEDTSEHNIPDISIVFFDACNARRRCDQQSQHSSHRRSVWLYAVTGVLWHA